LADSGAQFVMATNVATAAIAAGLIWFIGLGPFLLVDISI
jgi:hypothetical protein